MIKVTRLNDSEYRINPHQIEIIECKPDVTISMLSGKHYIVKESVEDVLEKIVAYRKRIGVFKNEL